MPSTMPTFFPDEKSENIIICIPYKGRVNKFSTIITNSIPDWHILEQSVCYPLYTYKVRIDGKKERVYNITDSAHNEYRTFYNDKKITKEDIFYYV